MRVALIGNPNTGKTTVFNALTGFRARVGNYAGVTVEKKIGRLRGAREKVELIDLPGTYSLSARSADEMIAVDVLMGNLKAEPKPDIVLVVVDASNLERNLFLASQVMELGLPTAILLNMMDSAEDAGIKVDPRKLSEKLGLPVIPLVASRGTGIGEVTSFLNNGALESTVRAPQIFPAEFVAEVTRLQEELISQGLPEPLTGRFLLRRALLEVDGIAEKRIAQEGGPEALEALKKSRERLTDHGQRLHSLEARARYGWIREQLHDVVARPETPTITLSDKIDRILIHKVWGTLIFAALMLVVFQAIYSWSGPFMDLIDGGFAALGEGIGSMMAEGPLRSLIVDGVIAGVGGILVFLPQILILFLFISILEDCGYMARAAFLMDKLLSKCGLSGRSFIPMLSSSACAIPGIMATRTIEDRRDRLTTILVAPLMSCSARLPVYTLLIGAFIPERTLVPGVLGLQAMVLFAMYLVGVSVAIPVAIILKRTLLKGETPSFMMELPPYKLPQWKAVVFRLWERAMAFIRRAGTIIFAVAVIVWALMYYPRPAGVETQVQQNFAGAIADANREFDLWLAQPATPDSEEALQAALAEAPEVLPEDAALAQGRDLLQARNGLLAERDKVIEGTYLRQSILGRMGQVVEPVARPLGWDWKIAMGAISSFPAREVIISTLGVIYDVGGGVDEGSVDLRDKLRNARFEDGRPVFDIAVALSIMVFFALCAQCAATLAVIRRETNSWRWPILTFAYMTVLAYIGAFLTYHAASWLIG